MATEKLREVAAEVREDLALSIVAPFAQAYTYAHQLREQFRTRYGLRLAAYGVVSFATTTAGLLLVTDQPAVDTYHKVVLSGGLACAVTGGMGLGRTIEKFNLFLQKTPKRRHF